MNVIPGTDSRRSMCLSLADLGGVRHADITVQEYQIRLPESRLPLNLCGRFPPLRGKVGGAEWNGDETDEAGLGLAPAPFSVRGQRCVLGNCLGSFSLLRHTKTSLVHAEGFCERFPA